jgi:hypothetical protein
LFTLSFTFVTYIKRPKDDGIVQRLKFYDGPMNSAHHKKMLISIGFQFIQEREKRKRIQPTYHLG